FNNGEWVVTDKYDAAVVDGIHNDLNSVRSDLAQTPKIDEVFLKNKGININDFDDPTRQTFLEAQGIDVNYVLGRENVKPENTTFFKIERSVNLLNLDAI